jgi:glyoxylase-like metal-dependent hydrolase (beta-lactamase superfamily II)
MIFRPFYYHDTGCAAYVFGSGHTPESVCLLVTDLRRGPEPWLLLTGDTLFVGAVGRPDLPGRVRQSAGAGMTRSSTRCRSFPASPRTWSE